MQQISPNLLKLYNFLFLFLLFLLSKLVNHPPNFTPLIAFIMISAFLVRSKIQLILIILSAMLISDIVIGIYNGVSITYIGFCIIALTVKTIFKRITYSNLILISLYSSFIFFLITSPLHLIFDTNTKINISSIIETYTDGFVFFFNTLSSTIIFGYLLYFITNKFVLKQTSFNSKI